MMNEQEHYEKYGAANGPYEAIGPAPVAAEVASINTPDINRFGFDSEGDFELMLPNGPYILYGDHRQAVADALAGQSVLLEEERTMRRQQRQRAEKAEAERDAAREHARDNHEINVQFMVHELKLKAALAQVAGGQVPVADPNCVGPLSNKQRNEARSLYSTLHHIGFDAADSLISHVAVQAYVNGHRDFAAPQPAPVEARALDKFNAYGEGDNDLKHETPIERLRFFCSIALNGQDWLDVEKFFDALQPAPVAGPVDAETPLLKLCSQLDSMKRRLRHIPGTGQNESYLLADDVACYVEEARAALATPPAISTSEEN